MKKAVKIFGLACIMTAAMTGSAFAGSWIQDVARPANVNGLSNWWYRNDDGTYPKNGWAWLDGNNDGVSECYRFDNDGWMYISTSVDGFEVNANGAWTVNFAVQEKRNAVPAGQGGAQTDNQQNPKNQWITDANGKRYFDSKGNMCCGWKKISGAKYYFDDGGYMVTGYHEIDGAEYYFLNDGKQALKTVFDSSDDVYYVIEKENHTVIDVVDASDWRSYKKDADSSLVDTSKVVSTDGTSHKNNSGSSQGGSLETGINEEWEMECFDLINEQRTKRGLSALEHDDAIQEACDVRAVEIAESFSHTRPDGTSCFTALEDAGVSAGGCGENICAGTTSPKAAVEAWMNSPGHKANILTKKFKKGAIGFYYDPDSEWTYHWVQLFTY